MTDKVKAIKELKEVLDNLDITNKYRLNLIRAIEYLQEEPVSEELEDVAVEWFNSVKYKSDLSGTPINAFKAGAKWQKEHLWKPFDGDDLPEIDREVIVLEGIVDPTASDCLCGWQVVFAHRPATEGYDGKSIATGVVEHYTSKTYDKGGWNIPNVKYWLDCSMPKEIEL